MLRQDLLNQFYTDLEQLEQLAIESKENSFESAETIDSIEGFYEANYKCISTSLSADQLEETLAELKKYESSISDLARTFDPAQQPEAERLITKIHTNLRNHLPQLITLPPFSEATELQIPTTPSETTSAESPYSYDSPLASDSPLPLHIKGMVLFSASNPATPRGPERKASSPSSPDAPLAPITPLPSRQKLFSVRVTTHTEAPNTDRDEELSSPRLRLASVVIE